MRQDSAPFTKSFQKNILLRINEMIRTGTITWSDIKFLHGKMSIMVTQCFVGKLIVLHEWRRQDLEVLVRTVRFFTSNQHFVSVQYDSHGHGHRGYLQQTS